MVPSVYPMDESGWMNLSYFLCGYDFEP
jgi:hypothetical protein